MKGGSTLLDLTYVYTAAAGQMGSSTIAGNSGQPVSVTGTINGQNRNQAFTYDNVGRLATATGLSTQGAWARRYDYDRHGNWTAVWDAVSGGNQLQNTALEQVGGIKTNRIASVNGTAFSYDASGNLTWDGARTYGYDAENRLVSVSTVSGGESYSYDASNHRVKKIVGGVVTHYVLEGDHVIAEYERGGGSTQATGTRYYHRDCLSTRLITDGAGNVKGATDHLPFGEEIGFTGESEKHKFTTYERDGALDYAVNRHYDPQRGRFNQVDPLGMGAASLADPQSLNLYSYVRNDPVNFVDPSGLLRIAVTCIKTPDGVTECDVEIVPDDVEAGRGGLAGGGKGGGGGGIVGGGGSQNPTPTPTPTPAPAPQQQGKKFSERYDLKKLIPCLADAVVNLGIGSALALGGPVGLLIKGILDMTGTDINVFQALAEGDITKAIEPFGGTDLVAGNLDLAGAGAGVVYEQAGGDAGLKRARDLATRGSYNKASPMRRAKLDRNLGQVINKKLAARILPGLGVLAEAYDAYKSVMDCLDKAERK
jgi:RHS repeat-associated protein